MRDFRYILLLLACCCSTSKDLRAAERHCLNCSSRSKDIIPSPQSLQSRESTSSQPFPTSQDLSLASISKILSSTLTSAILVDACYLIPLGVSPVRLNSAQDSAIPLSFSPASSGHWRGSRHHRFTSSLARFYVLCRVSFQRLIVWLSIC